MTRRLILNCDMGESYGAWTIGDDAAIMPLIDAANIACGGHAGDPGTMRHCVTLARRHGTEVGAHVSYRTFRALAEERWTFEARS